MRVSTMTVYRLIKAGDLPAIRVGKHLRIRGQDVAAFLDARVVRVPASRTSSAAPKTRSGHRGSAEGKPWPAA
jgi:excisionase family DNA binding protein